MKLKTWYLVITNKLYIIWHGYVLNPFWRGKACFREGKRRARFGRIRRTCSFFAGALDNIPNQKIVEDKNEKIFTIWQQGEKKAPPLIQACFRSIRKNCSQELVVLDDNNIFDYISLPDVIVKKYKKGKIGRAHFADICRVELLYKYGGIWMDATIFATSPLPKWLIDQDFFMYRANHVGVQNCFIRAKKGSYLLAVWRTLILEYWKNFDFIYGYWMHQMMFTSMAEIDERSKRLMAKMPAYPDTLITELWYNHAGEAFDQKKYNEYTAGASFQKTTYKSPYAENPRKGTVADVMINKMNKTKGRQK